MDKAFIQKIVGTIAGLVVIVVGYKLVPDARDLLGPIGGSILGGMWIRSPGDQKKEVE